MLPMHERDPLRGPGVQVSWFTPASRLAKRQMPFRRSGHHMPSLLMQLVVFSLLAGALVLALLAYSMKVQVPATAPHARVSVNLPRLSRRDLEAQRFFPAPRLTHLVLVAGHSVYTALDFHQAAVEKSWFLESYQQVPGEAQSFIQHIKLGVEAASEDNTAMLLFSGGQTRRDAGPRSEASSYWQVGEAMGWFNHTNVRDRAFTEEHARDSFENLLFGMCRFYELTGHYPHKVTVVSYQLKAARFRDVHRKAIRFPEERFQFKGSPIPEGTHGAVEGEAHTVAAFEQDPYSCSGTLLQKKFKRDPFAVGPPHPSRCPEMQELLSYCGAQLYTGYVPWL